MSARVIDLFCGTGGFSKGLAGAGGFDVVFGVDLLPDSVETFRRNHPDALGVAGDVHALRPRSVAEVTGLGRGQVDVIVGGPPCQGFSSIRPFRSSTEDDPRNTLFEEFAAYVAFFRPAVFVLENVVGLATHRQQGTLAAIVDCFDGLGYDTDWRILNAAHHGVPQKRERLILIGAERGTPIVFPAPTHRGEFKTVGIADPARRGALGVPARPLPPALTTMDAIGDLPPVRAGGWVRAYDGPPRNAYQRARRARSTELEWHVSTAHGERMLEIIRHAGPSIASVPDHLITSGFSSSYSRLSPDEPAATLTVNFVHPASNKCIHPLQDRALTLREGARIQSFDDDFRFAGTRTRIAKQIGNAVPPLLGRAIGGAVREMLGTPVRAAS